MEPIQVKNLIHPTRTKDNGQVPEHNYQGVST